MEAQLLSHGHPRIPIMERLFRKHPVPEEPERNRDQSKRRRKCPKYPELLAHLPDALVTIRSGCEIEESGAEYCLDEGRLKFLPSSTRGGSVLTDMNVPGKNAIVRNDRVLMAELSLRAAWPILTDM
jgi:hypothetical protein